MADTEVTNVNPEIASDRPEIKNYTFSWETPWVTVASCSDVGLVRPKNDDRLLVKPWPEQEALLLILADGLGGSQSGGLAAEIACNTFVTLVDRPLPTTAKERYEALTERCYAADQEILQRGGQSFQTLGMGCTVVAAIVTPQDCIHLYAGDSRLYHLRNKQVLYRSRDHSIVQLLLESGRITEEEIPTHPMRSVVNSCLGGKRSSEHFSIDPKWDEAEPPITLLQTQDWLMLSSDGFHGNLLNEAFCNQAFKENPDPTPEQLLQNLGRYALEVGGKDNLSAIAVRMA